jgi:hypothetical protein
MPSPGTTPLAGKDDIEVIQPSPQLQSEASSALDETYESYKNNQGLETDPAEMKKVLKKIDRRIVPILFFIYLLQYLDKNGINYASAWGLEEGVNLHGNDYSWLGMVRTISPLYRQIYLPLNLADNGVKDLSSTLAISLVNIPLVISCNDFPWQNSSVP